jgi:purine-binding chemotaxis protein CheW
MLVFRAGAVQLGIPARYVDALHAPPQSTRVPLTPTYVVGVAILRGEVVPLLDIEKYLELEAPSESTDRTRRKRGSAFERVAVVEASGMHVGVLCSEVRGIIPIRPTSSAEGRVTKGRMLEKVVAEEINTKDGVLVVLDLPKLLEEARVKL